MGDEQALQQLYGVNPQLAERIQMKKQQEAQNKLAMAGQQQKAAQNKQKAVMAIAKQAINMPFEQAQVFAADQARAMQIDAPPLTQEHYDQFKKVFGGKESEGAFSGTGMDAQVSNFLTKGVEDPAFRDTPEYARAWQMANEPKVIRTPTGDITLRPELSGIFKSPGNTSSQSEQIKDIKTTVKRDVEMIPGTEREEKTTADEKLSFGFFDRMQSAEKNIDSLGKFDSADVWERFKGMSNISASPELQQYRQAADDWIRAKLRRESGAAIAPGEMDSEYQIYFPQIGDKQAVINQKKEARKKAISAMEIAAGREAEKRGDSQTANFTGKDKDAYDWAKENSNDPRAKAIFEKLGVNNGF